MATPDTADNGGDDEGGGAVGGFDGTDNASGSDGDMQVGEVDLGVDNDGLVEGFDGVDSGDAEDSGGGGGSSASESGGSSGEGDISEAIENGLARTAAIGLEGREKDRVQNEMGEIAAEFKVGYFGEKCARKYLKTDLQDIPPEYGLAAALVAFAAVAIYKRPDGQERVSHAVSVVKEKFSGDDEQQAEPRPDAVAQQQRQQQARQQRQQQQARQSPENIRRRQEAQAGVPDRTAEPEPAMAEGPGGIEEPQPQPQPQPQEDGVETDAAPAEGTNE